MSSTQIIGSICRKAAQHVKAFEATLVRKALEMTGIRNNPYTRNIPAVIASRTSSVDISDKSLTRLEAMFNARVFSNADRNNPAEFFVGQHTSSKVACFDIRQVREEVEQAQKLADTCQPKVKAKLHGLLYSMEEKLGHMEYSRLQRWENEALSPKESKDIQHQLGYFPAAPSCLPRQDWAPQALALHPGVRDFHAAPRSFVPRVLKLDDGTYKVFWGIPNASATPSNS